MLIGNFPHKGEVSEMTAREFCRFCCTKMKAPEGYYKMLSVALCLSQNEKENSEDYATIDHFITEYEKRAEKAGIRL